MVAGGNGLFAAALDAVGDVGAGQREQWVCGLPAGRLLLCGGRLRDRVLAYGRRRVVAVGGRVGGSAMLDQARGGDSVGLCADVGGDESDSGAGLATMALCCCAGFGAVGWLASFSRQVGGTQEHGLFAR